MYPEFYDGLVDPTYPAYRLGRDIQQVSDDFDDAEIARLDKKLKNILLLISMFMLITSFSVLAFISF